MRHHGKGTTHGDPHSVSAIMACGSDRAKPKSATLRIGTPSGWPLARSSGDAGLRSKFYLASLQHIRMKKCLTHLRLDVSVDEIPLSQELQCTSFTSMREGRTPARRGTHTELAEKATDHNLVETSGSWMWVVRRRTARGRDVLQSLHSASFLDVV